MGQDLPSDVEAWIGTQWSRYPDGAAGRALVVGALRRLRGRWGPLGHEHLAVLADRLEIPVAHIFVAAREQAVRSRGEFEVRVCTDAVCMLSGADARLEHCRAQLGIAPGETTEDGRITLKASGCLGACAPGPTVSVSAMPSMNGRVFAQLDAAQLVASLDQLRAGELPQKVDSGAQEATGAGTAVTARVAGDRSFVFSRRFGGSGDYAYARRAYSKPAVRIIEQVEAARLSERAGPRGVSVAAKWARARRDDRDRCIVAYACALAESFKDYELLRTNPQVVLEGAMIAARALGVTQVFVAMHGVPPAFRQAVEDADTRGLLGARIFGTEHRVEVTLVDTEHPYSGYDDHALVRLLEGPGARVKPVACDGPPLVWGRHAVVHNVETLAALPWIVAHTGDVYAALARGDASGTQLCAVVGHVRRPGLYEVPRSTTVAEVVDLAGGVRTGRRLKAVFPGLWSAARTPDELDVMLEGQGTACSTVAVLDSSGSTARVLERVLQRAQPAAWHESPKCRSGLQGMAELVGKFARGRGTVADLRQLHALGHASAAACGPWLAQLAWSAVATSTSFGADFEQAVANLDDVPNPRRSSRGSWSRTQ